MSEWELIQCWFYQRACADHRISPTHISLYFALLHEAGHTVSIPFYLQREKLKAKAKICSAVTMNKCLRDLHAYGYINYRPSFTPGQSMVELLAPEPS